MKPSTIWARQSNSHAGISAYDCRRYYGVSPGLVAVSAITLIGIPLIPFILGYLLGVYALAMQMATSFPRQPESPAGQLIVLALGLIAGALINFIPVVGWVISIGVAFLGLGALTSLCRLPSPTG